MSRPTSQEHTRQAWLAADEYLERAIACIDAPARRRLRRAKSRTDRGIHASGSTAVCQAGERVSIFITAPKISLAMPEPIKDWSMTTLKEKLITIGAKVVSHGRYIAFQMAEVAISKNLFAEILRMIAELRPPPVASTG
jgi:Transposase DDE domain group 1